jgi:chromosome segregation ATPase
MATTEIQAVETGKEQVPLDITEPEKTVEVEEPSVKVSGKEKEVPSVEVAEESEQEQYSKTVQKRINQLTKRVKETEREREEAVRYAQNVRNESEEVKSRLRALDQSYLSEYGGPYFIRTDPS